PRGRLFQTNGPSGLLEYEYDGDALVGEYDGLGKLSYRFVHGPGVDEPLIGYRATDGSIGNPLTGSGVNREFYHADHQGSIIAAASGNGLIQRVNTYDLYGVPSVGNGGRFQYTGQIALPDLPGLYHYKARVYHSALGRFMQVDPVGYKDDIDLYAYVGD